MNVANKQARRRAARLAMGMAFALIAMFAGSGLADEPPASRNSRTRRERAEATEEANEPADDSSIADESAEEPAPAQALPISPPGEGKGSRKGLPLGGGAPRREGWTSLGATFGSLAVVLGLFAAVAWGLRKARPKSLQPLSTDVFEALGRAPLAGRLQAHLFRCGNKLLLVSISTGGAETLTEITDPGEVDRLTGLCRAQQPQSTTASFKQIWREFAKEKTSDSFVDGTEASASPAPQVIAARVPASRGRVAALFSREAKRA